MNFFPGLRLAGILLSAFLSACASVSSDAPPLSQSFNKAAVADKYALSCAEKDESRLRELRDPVQPDTVSYFQKDEKNPVLYSPYLSQSEKEKAQKLAASLPPHVADLIYTQGGVLIFTARSLGEIGPYYAQYKNENGREVFNNGYAGIYDGRDRRISMTFNFLINGRLVPLRDNLFAVAAHESGHFVDDIIGEFGRAAEESHIRFSDTDEFINAYMADLRALARPGSGFNEQQLRRISYYLPKELAGRAFPGGQNSIRMARFEAFAELWAEVRGHNNLNLSRFFPRASAIVRDLDDQLQRLHREKAPECRLFLNSPNQSLNSQFR